MLATSDQPGQSILLNGPTRRKHASSVSSQSYASSSSRITSSPSASTSSLYSEGPSSVVCSGKVSFAPLPEVPPELKRRSSITLGVLARKNMLQGQGGGAAVNGRNGGGGQRGEHKAVMMTDAEWDDYKKRFETRKSGKDAVDLGDIARASAKSLWRKVRSSSQSSQSSYTSTSSAALPPSPQLPTKISRRDSAPIGTSPTTPDRDGANLAVLVEEEHEPDGPTSIRHWQHGLQIESTDGDATPRRLPSPPPRPADTQDGEDQDEEEEVEEGPSMPRSPPRRFSRDAVAERLREKNAAVAGYDTARFSGTQADWRSRR